MSKIRKQETKKRKADIRFLYDMENVVYDKKWLKTTPNFPLYYMYREVKKKNGLRYDITVISSRMLGKEFAKTKGHDHSRKIQRGLYRFERRGNLSYSKNAKKIKS